jgi:hypothetical protein
MSSRKSSRGAADGGSGGDSHKAYDDAFAAAISEGASDEQATRAAKRAELLADADATGWSHSRNSSSDSFSSRHGRAASSSSSSSSMSIPTVQEEEEVPDGDDSPKNKSDDAAVDKNAAAVTSGSATPAPSSPEAAKRILMASMYLKAMSRFEVRITCLRARSRDFRRVLLRVRVTSLSFALRLQTSRYLQTLLTNTHISLSLTFTEMSGVSERNARSRTHKHIDLLASQLTFSRAFTFSFFSFTVK